MTNASGTYGGGRLAAFLLAQCLARAGAEVAFVTNAKPVFYEDLKHFGHPGRVAFHQTKDFHAGLPAGGFDIVIIIPGQSQDRQFYIGARGFARRRGARLVLFNFETPNWFNSQAPTTRSEDMWLEWRRCIEDGCLVLSNSEQSMRFAQDYYCSHPETTFFDYWHQPINLQALARVAPQYRENRAVCFVRARDPHKGGQDLIDALSEDLRGWTLSLIVGSAKLDEEYHEAIAAAARRHQIAIEVKPLLSDTDKFVELKRARMLIYPSRFEGYGIPPIEALSAGTPCVCYDLPVFREVCGDALIAVPSGDIEGLRAGIRQVIASSPADWNHLPQQVASVSSILQCGQAALAALQTYLRQEIRETGHALPAPRRASERQVWVDTLRVDPGGFLEIRGGTGLEEPGRLLLTLNGARAAEAVPRGGRYLLLHPLPREAHAEEAELSVLALGHNGQVLDSASSSLMPSRLQASSEAAALRHGGWRWLREGDTACVIGWITADAPILGLQAHAGGRRLWLQSGINRPDLRGRGAGAGLSIHLSAEDLAALDAVGELLLLAGTDAGARALHLAPSWEPAQPGEPEWPPELPGDADPFPLPVQAHLHRATYDEYGVAEFDGWVQARPRVDVIKFWLAGAFLGETAPDRLQLHIHERHRAYGDAYCGFHLAGRLTGLTADRLQYRVEFCQGDAPVHVLEGMAAPQRRAQGPLGSDAALLPPGLLDSEDEVVVLVVEDARLLEPLAGAAQRATLRYLRDSGRRVVLVLHGNPHRFADDLPRWQALADGVVLVNAMTPRHSARLPPAG
ncbi:glycosyltransferase [Roseomonas marmotae]|uniref:glycosyltransferase n=1 Tax=Roseomonas marmotae TaxID=2768161 RepID=UPI001AD73F20|nr:glycosyltransferase [Roseomonas marmotae]QTI80535.1 glycosyltransferase [Roseomonas marmotae]